MVAERQRHGTGEVLDGADLSEDLLEAGRRGDILAALGDGSLHASRQASLPKSQSKLASAGPAGPGQPGLSNLGEGCAVQVGRRERWSARRPRGVLPRVPGRAAAPVSNRSEAAQSGSLPSGHAAVDPGGTVTGPRVRPGRGQRSPGRQAPRGRANSRRGVGYEPVVRPCRARRAIRPEVFARIDRDPDGPRSQVTTPDCDHATARAIQPVIGQIGQTDPSEHASPTREAAEPLPRAAMLRAQFRSVDAGDVLALLDGALFVDEAGNHAIRPEPPRPGRPCRP